MMRERLRETDEFQEIAGEQAAEQVDQAQRYASETVVSLEKSDVQFWAQIASVVLLFLIYRELARANGKAVAEGLTGAR